jgi:hypothetical protein
MGNKKKGSFFIGVFQVTYISPSSHWPSDFLTPPPVSTFPSFHRKFMRVRSCQATTKQSTPVQPEGVKYVCSFTNARVARGGLRLHRSSQYQKRNPWPACRSIKPPGTGFGWTKLDCLLNTGILTAYPQFVPPFTFPPIRLRQAVTSQIAILKDFSREKDGGSSTFSY